MKTLMMTFALFTLASCGADKLNQKSSVATSSSNLTSASECSATSSYSPVCASGKDYDNIEIAKCFGAKTDDVTIGHCDCTKNTIPVCGSDGQDYSECDAKKDENLTIVKFVPCAAKEN
jgi:hypothetical protein